MKRGISLRIKVFLLLSTGPLFMLFMAALFWGPARQLGTSLGSVEVLHKNLQLVTSMGEARRAAVSAVFSSVLSGELRADEYDEHMRDFDRSWGLFRESDASDQMTSEVVALRDLANRQRERELLILSKIGEGDMDEAQALLTADYLDRNEVLIGNINKLALFESSEIVGISNQTQRAVADFAIVFLEIFIASIVLGILLVWLFLRRFKSRIDNLSNTAQAIAAGDFSKRVEVRMNDELGRFAESFNRMAQRMESMNQSMSREVESRTTALEESIQKLKKEEDTIESTEDALLNILEDLKNDEQRLKASEERYRKLIEAVPVGIAVHRDNEIIYVNSAALRILNAKSEEDVLGKDVMSFVAPEGVGPIKKRIDKVRKDGEVGVEEEVFKTIDGKTVDVAATGSATKFGGKDAVMVTFIDISERKKAEEELRKLNRLKSRFITALTHVTRTPLNAIRWNMELLLSEDMGQLRDEQKTLVQNALQSERQILRLLRHMNIVLDIERGTLHLDRETTSVAGLVSSVSGEFKDYFELADIDLFLELKEERGQAVSVDVEMLRIALEILFNNALKYSPEGSEVHASLELEQGNKLRFSIKDSGIGIPESEQRFIFDRFYRASNASTKHPDGVGLGLYIAKSVIERHGGEMGFESKEGEGTTFWFTLPINND